MARIAEEGYGSGRGRTHSVSRVVIDARETGGEQLLCPKLAGAVVITRAYAVV